MCIALGALMDLVKDGRGLVNGDFLLLLPQKCTGLCVDNLVESEFCQLSNISSSSIPLSSHRLQPCVLDYEDHHITRRSLHSKAQKHHAS